MMICQPIVGSTASASRPATGRRPSVVMASSTGTSSRVPEVARRQILGSAGLSLASFLLPSLGASAFSVAPNTTLCSYAGSDELSDDCRKKALGGGSAEAYGDVTGRNKANEKSDIVSGVPVPVLDSEYARATLQVLGDIQTYTELDVYDKARIPLIKKMKAESIGWVSKYARGGSARSDSARRAYIAVDAVIGYLASNGLAPFPAGKAKTVLATIGQARTFLADGK